MRIKFSIFAACIAIAGCAASPYQLGSAALKAGDLKKAEAQLSAAVSDGNADAWNDLGVVYLRTGRRDAAIRCFQMAARYGNPTGQKNLVALGLPVPAVDLKPQESSSAGWAAALKGLNDGMNGRSYFGSGAQSTPSQKPIFCDSKASSGGSVSTTCY